jgi:hypothetical protein
MTLAELKTKTLAEILQEKDLCLVVLKEDAFAKIQDNLGRLSYQRQEQLKNLILDGLKQVLIIQQQAKKEMTEETEKTIQSIYASYEHAEQEFHRYQEQQAIQQDTQAAENILSPL